MNNNFTNCIACDSAQVKKRLGRFSIIYQGKAVEVPGIESYCCSKCGETFLDLDNEAKIDMYLQRQRTQPVATGIK